MDQFHNSNTWSACWRSMSGCGSRASRTSCSSRSGSRGLRTVRSSQIQFKWLFFFLSTHSSGCSWTCWWCLLWIFQSNQVVWDGWRTVPAAWFLDPVYTTETGLGLCSFIFFFSNKNCCKVVYACPSEIRFKRLYNVFSDDSERIYRLLWCL